MSWLGIICLVQNLSEHSTNHEPLANENRILESDYQQVVFSM